LDIFKILSKKEKIIMKRNKSLRIAAILLALVMVSVIGMAGTLARYTATFADVSSTTIRAGIFRVEANADSAEFELEAFLGGVEGIDGEIVIVPGSTIKLTGDILIDNLSEVDVEIVPTATIVVTGFDVAGGSELQFSNDGIDFTLTSTQAAAGLFDAGDLNVAAGDDETLVPNLYIRWPVAGNNTAAGTANATHVLATPAGTTATAPHRIAVNLTLVAQQDITP
jgi:hypothetical protein